MWDINIEYAAKTRYNEICAQRDQDRLAKRCQTTKQR